MSIDKELPISLAVSSHPRLSEFNRLVYPVNSRRAGGLSLGINLNPNKACSFDCVYCQVDRRDKISGLKVSLEQIEEELTYWIGIIKQEKGELKGLKLKDIAIAGDGEPTTCKLLPQVMLKVLELKNKMALDRVKPILFTNGSSLNKPEIEAVLPKFYQENGQIWFKLDFWNEETFKKINRSSISHSRIVDNLVHIGSQYPLIFQTCVFLFKNQDFSLDEYRGYVTFVQQLLSSGVKIQKIQLYTVARKPKEAFVKPWPDLIMNELHSFFDTNLPIDIELFYSGK